MERGETDNTSGAGLHRVAAGTLVALAAIKLVVHLCTNFQYDFFRDEIYYIQWAERLAWGYVEQPPLTAWVIFLTRAVLGESLFALRLFPTLCGVAMVVLTGLIAREMGGGRYAQGFAALCLLVGPVFLGNHALMTMNAFDQLAWVVCVWLLARLVRTGNGTLWLWFGLWAGLGLMNKLSMPFFGTALVAALLLTRERRWLFKRHIWAGGCIAVAIFSPFIVWLALNDWVTVEFMLNYGGGGKTWQAGFFEYLYMHIMGAHPLTFPVWALGLWCCFRADGGRFRVLGWLFVVLYAMFYVMKAKFYFLAPAFPMLLAAGAVRIEQWLEAPRLRWTRWALPSVLAAGGCVTAPLVLPVLPPDLLVRYAGIFGGNAGIKTEQLEERELPQHFADQFGWEATVENIAQVYNALPPEEREVCAIFTANYGEAAAVDFYGPALGLPPAISGHNTYHLWGPRGATGDVVIVMLYLSEAESLNPIFEEVELAGMNDCGLCIPHEREAAFFVCRRSRQPLRVLWPMFRHFD